MALSHLRGETITTMGVGVNGVRCQLWYEQAVLRSLREYDWGFARSRVTLSAHADAPPDQWAYRYTFPTCVKFLRIWNPAGENAPPIPYQKELNAAGTAVTILTNEPDAIAVVTLRVAESLFTPEFIENVSNLMAHYLAMDVTGKMMIKREMLQYYQTTGSKNAGTDANEDKPDNETRDAEWVEGRM